MTDDRYYIAKDNYSLDAEDGHSIDICIGNQFILLEDLHNDKLKLKCIDSSMSDLSQIILPCSILQDMSKPNTCKAAFILRSQSLVKDRISSFNLSDHKNETQKQFKYNTLGHGILQEGVSRTKYELNRCQTLPTAIKLNSEVTLESDLRKSIKIKKDEINIVDVTDNSLKKSKWMRVTENDRDVYINNETGERWHTAVDDGGREYYYSEGSQQSSWKLPDSDDTDDLSFGDEAVRSIEDVLQGMDESSDSDVSYKDDADDIENKDKNTDVITPSSVSSPTNRLSDIQDSDSRFNIKQIKKEHISGPLFNKLMRTERSGTVEKTKFNENGREVPKKWASFHTVLTGPELLFYKDTKAAIVKPGLLQGKVELKLKIQNLEFSERTETGDKLTILQVEDKGAPGSSITYLLRYSSTEEMQAWKAALQFAKSWQNENMYSDNAFKTESSPIEDISSDKQNIGLKLIQLLTKRPTRESLEARGIIKLESVFGSSLDILCEQEQSKVPEFVFRCILAIEARGLHHNGLYRISGNQAKIQKLRLSVDENKYQLNSEFVELETLTGALKSFFKELKEPLFDEEFCKKMVDILAHRKADKKNPYRDINQSSVKKLMSKLKPSHYETAKALLGHLHRVSLLSHKNLMGVSNLSMVWGPNLYLVSGQASTKLAIILMTHNQIIDYILTFYSELFERT